MFFCLEFLTSAYIEIQWYLNENDKNSNYMIFQAW